MTVERTLMFGGDGANPSRLVDRVRALNRTFSLSLRDISADNLALFVGAPEPASITDSAVAVTDEELTVRPGRWYQLGVAADCPAGVGAVSDAAGGVTITDADNGESYARDVDFQLDAAHGRLHIARGGAIAAATTVRVTYTPVAGTRRQVRAGGPRDLRAALRNIEDSDIGAGRHYFAPLCAVSAGGEDLALKSRDSEQQIHLACDILDPGAGKAALLIDGEAA